MVERFVINEGLISVANGASVVIGVGTLFGGKDLAGAAVIAFPVSGSPIRVGTVAEVDPEGIYEDLSLPLVTAFPGTSIVSRPYEVVDGLGMANGSSQAAIFARYTAHLEQNMGLIGNIADVIDYSLVPNNSLFVDAVTRTIYQWRNGVLTPVQAIATAFTPRGAYAGGTTYAQNDMVQSGSYLFVSNVNGNLGNAPNTAPASTAFWTYYPTTGVQPVLDALGIHGFTISDQQPSGGVNGDVWFVVQ